jgi:hypothetical protein
MAFHLRRQQRDLDLSSFTPILPGRKKRQQSQMSSPASSRTSSPHGKMSRRTKAPELSERRLATIESLPAELLAQIFSYTCNLALPKASKWIGQKLTGEAVYRAYFKRLFWQVDLYKKDDICVGTQLGKAYTKPPCVVDELAEIQSYKTKVLLCRWMTADRFERYRGQILASVRNVPDTEQLELYMDDDDTYGNTSGLRLWLPTTLLRYRAQSGSERPDRGFELLRVLLRYYLIQLDPLGDGNEQARDMFHQALLKDDFQLVYLFVRNMLPQDSWITDIRVALENTDNPPKMWNLVYWTFLEVFLFRLIPRSRPFSYSFFMSELQGLRDELEDDFPGACDPITCFSVETAEDFRQALARTGDPYWTAQAEVVTDYLKARSREYMPNYIAAGRVVGYR